MCTTSCSESLDHVVLQPLSDSVRRRAHAVVAVWILAHLVAGVALALSGAWMPVLLLFGSGASAVFFFFFLPEPLCWIVPIATLTLVEFSLALPAWI